MMRMLASGAWAAAALARSRTMEALVLKRSMMCKPRKVDTLVSTHTITGHAWLARNTSGDHDNLGALEAVPQRRWCTVIALDL